MIRLLLWRCSLIVAAAFLGPVIARAQAPKSLQLKDGDRIVFLGDGFFEGEYEHGYIETAITSRFPDLHLTFRNLGWTGDTVWGDARAGFDTAKEGFARRAALVKELKPNVILVCYGMNESFAGEAGLPKFEEGLKALLDSLRETGAKIALISPVPNENLGSPFPNPTERNQTIAKYSQVISGVARDLGCLFIEVSRFNETGLPEDRPNGTSDGIHLNAFGYWCFAQAIEEAVFEKHGEHPYWWTASLNRAGRSFGSPLSGTALSDLETLQSGFRVRAQDHYLPLVDPTVHGPGWKRPLIRFFFTFNLNSGRYELKVDNQIVAIATETEWSMGVQLTKGPEVAQAESLRRAIVDKNQLLFHRLRPQNETYLYLFRKHEQGHMAGEVPQFDPLIAEKEAEIDKLKKPVPHTYELIRVEEKK